MAVVHMRKSSLSTSRQWYGDCNEEYSKAMLRRCFYQHKLCSACCGFYGPNFGQPLCVTCHAFLYPEDVNILDSCVVYQEKSDSEDSGNEEPSDFYEIVHQRQERPPTILRQPKLDKLSECITALISPRRKDVFQEGLIENLPSEVLTVIFSFLDDFSLWNCSQVCKRWSSVIEANNNDEKWRQYTRRRWQLFKPTYVIPCWRIMYTKLAQSAPCMLCLHQMLEQAQPAAVYSSWRTIRLRNELKSLHSDPPEGIEAIPLDDMCYQWQASITGPKDSPYEGGTFFLYLQIPPGNESLCCKQVDKLCRVLCCTWNKKTFLLMYPMKPPIVRFITKIFHPNVSRHGDIGIDSIRDNWSLILTISKILISIQSLLTDPYCHVCMEPEVGRLYQENKSAFESIARLWTLRFAMFHKRPTNLEKPQYLSQENGVNPNL